MDTTKGPWIVGLQILKGSPDRREHIAVVVADNPSVIVAVTGVTHAPDQAESIANAALIAIAPDMLDTLIAIQETLMNAKTIDREAMSQLISDVFEKLANEAGEEL